MTKDLSNEKCVPCSIGTPPMEGLELKRMLAEIGPTWQLVEKKQIEKSFKFKDFKSALDFVNKVGIIAEEEGHHPDIKVGWGRAKITLITHKIGGLSRNDFLMAAKINKL
ncbi:MAG: 4a-hydroxytetrahydrobiopterin dehydratase [Eubacteriales bacterium]|nr:4a-hydroxytetrahydrobiopterin dehydratase [Eubacteriales bacterium]